MRCGIYSRQSKDNTKSIEQQCEEQTQDAISEGWQIAKVYSDGTSASRFATKKRDEWPQLLKDVENDKLDVVSLWEASRGDRNNTRWNQFLDLCADHKVLIRIKSHGRTYDVTNHRDWRSLAEDGIDSDYESRKTSERIRRDMRSNAEAGRPTGKPVYGYEREYAVVGGKSRIVAVHKHPTQAKIVLEAATRVADYEGVLTVVKDFNRRGITAPMGGLWTATQVSRLCTNLTYRGIRKHNGQLYPAIWPAIIPQDIFDACQQILGSPKRKKFGSYGNKTKHLLTGIAMCSVCDSTMRTTVMQGKAMYQCRDGHHVSMLMADLDDYVDEDMRARMFALDTKELGNPEEAQQREAAKAQVEVLRAEREQWLQEATRLRMKPADMLAYLQARDAEIEALEAKSQAVYIPAYVHELAEHPEMWDDANIYQKRELIRDMVEIRIKPVGRGNRYVAVKDRVSLTTISTMGWIAHK